MYIIHCFHFSTVFRRSIFATTLRFRMELESKISYSPDNLFMYKSVKINY